MTQNQPPQPTSPGGDSPLDEYDAPLQEVWLSGYWEGMSVFVRSLFNSTFKTNSDLGCEPRPIELK